MASIKIHVAKPHFSNDGSESCDFRGENFIGHEQGDEHATIFERQDPPEDFIAEVLENGPEWNRMNGLLLAEMIPSSFLSGAMSIANAKPALRIGVWDE